MKQRTKKRAALYVLAAVLVATWATAAAAQGTQSPRPGGTYQYGDADRTNRANGTNGANGADTPQRHDGTDDRRQSGYPQPGTSADASGTRNGAMQDSTSPPPTQDPAQGGR
ncbi:MAG TPA: hypothetical protein VL689_02665 [Paraburkholderia sp.]|jgi:hypothetical protein|nr:hypothetical protein [Paraburkholderia sp.]